MIGPAHPGIHKMNNNAVNSRRCILGLQFSGLTTAAISHMLEIIAFSMDMLSCLGWPSLICLSASTPASAVAFQQLSGRSFSSSLWWPMVFFEQVAGLSQTARVQRGPVSGSHPPALAAPRRRASQQAARCANNGTALLPVSDQAIFLLPSHLMARSHVSRELGVGWLPSHEAEFFNA